MAVKNKRDLLLISVDSPIMLGIYENKKLVKSFSAEGKFSDSLPNLFSKIFAESSGDSVNFLLDSTNRTHLSSLQGDSTESPKQSTESSLRDSAHCAESWQSTNFCDSKNNSNQLRVAQPQKALSGAGVGVVREGEGSDFAIQAPTPSLKENARGQRWDSNADLSARERKAIDSSESLKLQNVDCFGDESPRNDDIFLDSSPTAQNDNLNEDAEFANIFYTNGPGNFSAIKLTHIFLQTLSITKNISLFCADAFHFSDNEFINAYGKVHFVKENGEIRTITLDSKRVNAFSLPSVLDSSIFSTDCAPLYILPAV